jgi:hypothetical protein
MEGNEGMQVAKARGKTEIFPLGEQGIALHGSPGSLHNPTQQ